MCTSWTRRVRRCGCEVARVRVPCAEEGGFTRVPWQRGLGCPAVLSADPSNAESPGAGFGSSPPQRFGELEMDADVPRTPTAAVHRRRGPGVPEPVVPA